MTRSTVIVRESAVKYHRCTVCQGTVELRDGDLSSGSVKVEVVRHAASQQLLQTVVVRPLSDTAQPHLFTLSITVITLHSQ